MVVGEALCNICPEPVTERLEATVTKVASYCIALYCPVLHRSFIVLCCAASPVVIGEALCNVCSEAVQDLEAAVTNEKLHVSSLIAV